MAPRVVVIVEGLQREEPEVEIVGEIVQELVRDQPQVPMVEDEVEFVGAYAPPMEEVQIVGVYGPRPAERPEDDEVQIIGVYAPPPAVPAAEVIDLEGYVTEEDEVPPSPQPDRGYVVPDVANEVEVEVVECRKRKRDEEHDPRPSRRPHLDDEEGDDDSSSDSEADDEEEDEQEDYWPDEVFVNDDQVPQIPEYQPWVGNVLQPPFDREDYPDENEVLDPTYTYNSDIDWTFDNASSEDEMDPARHPRYEPDWDFERRRGRLFRGGQRRHASVSKNIFS